MEKNVSEQQMRDRAAMHDIIKCDALSVQQTIMMIRDAIKSDPHARELFASTLEIYPYADPDKYPEYPVVESKGEQPEKSDEEWQKELAEADKAYYKWRKDPWYDPDMEEYYKLDDGYEE